MRKKQALALILLLLIATMIRTYRVRALTTFRADQAIELASAREILQGDFKLIGIKTSNSELRNGAVMYYPLAGMVALFRGDPLAGGALQILLQLIGLAVIFLIGLRYASGTTAVLSTFLLATNALLVVFSRQTMLAFYPFSFAAMSLWLFLRIRESRRAYEQIAGGILIGMAIQVHYSTLSLLFLALVFPWLFSLPQKVRYYGYLILGFCIGFSPMILFEIRNQFFNTQMFVRLLTSGSSEQQGLAFFSYWRDIAALLLTGTATWWTWGVIGLFGMGMIRIRHHFNALHQISVAMIVANMVFSVLFVRGPVIHYAIVSYAPFLLLLASTIATILKHRSRLGRAGIGTGIALAYFCMQVPAYGWHDTHGYTMDEGWNLLGVEKAAQMIRNDSAAQSFNVTMLIDAQSEGLPLRYYLDGWGKRAMGLADYDKAQILYVVAPGQLDIRGINPYELSAFGAYDIERRWLIQQNIYLYRLIHYRQSPHSNDMMN